VIEAREAVLRAPPAVHGGPGGVADERVPVRIDFSTSVSAWGPARVVVEAARAAPLDAYPDPEALAPRRAAARRWGRPPGEVAFGAGAAELIHAACAAFLRADDLALVAGPTFGEYARAAALRGARAWELRAAPPRWTIAAENVAAAVAAHRPRVVFLCAPNNPTGQTFSRDELLAVADACRGAGALLVLDQSYDAFAAAPLGTPALGGHPAVLHVRSVTKDHALAGVRAGFAVGPPGVIAAIERARVPWSASAPAQAAAAATFLPEAEAHAAGAVLRLRAECAAMRAALGAGGFAALATGVHYFLLDSGDAAAARERLLAGDGLKVRDCASFGLPRHVRIAARTPAENAELLAALPRVLHASTP